MDSLKPQKIISSIIKRSKIPETKKVNAITKKIQEEKQKVIESEEFICRYSGNQRPAALWMRYDVMNRLI